MSLINNMKLFSVKAAGASNQTTIYSDEVDTKLCEGVLFFTAIPDAQANSNFMKIQACAEPTFASDVLDIIGAKAAPSADGDLVAVDVSEIPLRYVRAAIVKAGPDAFAAGQIFAAKYGLAKQPSTNDGTDGGVGVSVEIINTDDPTGTIERPEITNPTADEENVVLDDTITSSTYAVRDGSDTHDATQYQITEIVETPVEGGDPTITIDWDAAVVDETTATGVEELVLAGTELANETDYAIRVRYNSATLGWSDWSEVIEFTTIAAQ